MRSSPMRNCCSTGVSQILPSRQSNRLRLAQPVRLSLQRHSHFCNCTLSSSYQRSRGSRTACPWSTCSMELVYSKRPSSMVSLRAVKKYVVLRYENCKNWRAQLVFKRREGVHWYTVRILVQISWWKQSRQDMKFQCIFTFRCIM